VYRGSTPAENSGPIRRDGQGRSFKNALSFC
jgi:hypothetical protein